MKRLNFSDEVEHRRVIRLSLRRLWIKKHIKRRISDERREIPPFTIDPVSVEFVPIRTIDESPLIYHGASVEDIRELLRMIPAGYTDGLNEVRLCLGKNYLENQSQDWLGYDIRNPQFGRRCIESFPGLYAPHVLGTCFTGAGIISLYAHVWDRSKLGSLPEFVPAFYLKLVTLSVLLHEVAHHFDRTNRIARGRWRMARKEIVEEYAEMMEHCWQSEYLYPFIIKKYGADWKAFQEWVAHHGGLLLKLGQPIKDRLLARRGFRICEFPINDAIEKLMESVIRGESLYESRYSYAHALCLADEFEDSLAITGQLILLEPNNSKFLRLHAYTLSHLQRWEEARASLDQALKLDLTDIRIWEALARLAEKQRDWSGLLRLSEQGLIHVGNKKSRALLIYKATALYAFSRFAEMEETLLEVWNDLPEERRSKNVLMAWRKNIYKVVYGVRR